jgi:hypothetical protein
MKKATYIIYVLLTLISTSMFSQSKTKFATPNQIDKDGPSLFVPEQKEKDSKASELVSPEEARRILFNIEELKNAYSELVGLQPFYSSRNGKDLWQMSVKLLFSDYKSPSRDNCASILKSYPNKIEPVAPPKFHALNAIHDIMGRDLFDEFSYCISYLGLSYLDKEIWDTYVSKEVKLIQEVKSLQLSTLRLKGFILATDFQMKVCAVEQGLQTPISNITKP